jgi:cell division protein FtsN
MVNSVVQLNQQVYGFISDLKGNTQLPVDLFDKKVADLVAKQDMVSKALAMLQVKMGDALDKVSIEPIALETHKPEVAQERVVLAPTSVPVPAKEIAPVKTEAAHVQVKEAVDLLSSKKEALKEIATNKEKAKLETVPTKIETKPEASPTKPEIKPETKSEKSPSKVPVTSAPVKVKAEPEVVTAKPKPTVAPIAIVKPEPEKAKKQQVSANWGVNLVAFKQEWFAKSKAAEFARQGIYAEVIPVQGNNLTLYRLRVGGFKNKAEATASKDRIKKILNLDSVWVSDN